MSVIYFYNVQDEYGCFSNFAIFPIKLKGKMWPTSEHYFQAQKFVGKKNKNEIRKASSPMVAARKGRERKRKIRKDWEKIKESTMKDAIYAKFTQHDELKEVLLSTGSSTLVERTDKDLYWGDGGDGSGKNRLGILLMQLRDQLVKEENGKRGQVLQSSRIYE